MLQRPAQLFATPLALRLFQLAGDACPGELDRLAPLLQLDLLGSLLRLLLRVLRRLGVEPRLLHRLHFVPARHGGYFPPVVDCVASPQRATPARRRSGRSSAVRKPSFIIFKAASVKAPR